MKKNYVENCLYNCDFEGFMGSFLYGCDAQVAGIIMLWVLAIGWHSVPKYLDILNILHLSFLWTFFLIRNYFTPIKNQLMILILKKLSLDKLAIVYYLTPRQFIVNRADL